MDLRRVSAYLRLSDRPSAHRINLASSVTHSATAFLAAEVSEQEGTHVDPHIFSRALHATSPATILPAGKRLIGDS
ncbi:hypothetical protein [Onishia niordana]|uniref:hypothetical protein n=1 Tax=Onishia niordana TaxID=2508711 RepID=UPI0010A087BC|nr:hypothetical protein [Halomonas niordiana]